MTQATEKQVDLKMSLLVLFVVSMIILGLEILLTRIFAVVLFASHSFMAISLALLGTGAGAILAYLGKPLPIDKFHRRQILILVLIAVTIIISLWGLLQIEFVPLKMMDPDSGEIRNNLSYNKRFTMLTDHPEVFNSWKLYAALPIAFLPFLLGGFLQALIFRHSPKKFGMLYGVDLIGATVGSIFMPLLLYPFGLMGTISAIALVALIPIAYYYITQHRSWHYLIGMALPVLILVVLVASGSFRVQHAAGFSTKNMIREMWSPMARVSLMKFKPSEHTNREMYVIDNGSRTHYVPQTERNLRRYRKSLYTIPFEMKTGGSLLVIASGGGQELTMANHHGMKKIDAVEIARPIVTDILNNKKDEPGNPYYLPGVNYFIADGRSVAMRSKEKYDVIEMLEVNFHTLAGQIAQAWSPFFVFTQEAYSEYIQHVKENGFVCYTIFSRADHPIAGEKGRRFRSLIAGMKIAGIKDPSKNLVILTRPYVYGYRTMYMVKPTPYTPQELASLATIAESRHGDIVVQFPNVRKITKDAGLEVPFNKELVQDTKHIRTVRQMCRSTEPLTGYFATMMTDPKVGVPVNDDRPYMIGSGLSTIRDPREKLISQLYKNLLTVMGILAVLFVILPFVIRRPGGAGSEKIRLDPRLLLILGMTGVGFMFVEMAGIYKYQLYLHHPTIAMMVILSSMILGAGLGSLHTGRIPKEKRELSIALYAGGVVIYSGIMLILVPSFAHKTMLLLPMPILVSLIFVTFVGLGFLLGHVVPLSIAAFAEDQPNLLAWAWAVTVTGSVFGTVLASILSRDYGMILVAFLGMLAYTWIVIVALAGKAMAGRFKKKTAKPA